MPVLYRGANGIKLALVLVSLATLGLVRIASAQVTGQIVQQFYVPFPEADFKTSLQAIAAANAVSNQIHDYHLDRGWDLQHHYRV